MTTRLPVRELLSGDGLVALASGSGKVAVFLVEDRLMIRHALARALNRQPQIEVQGLGTTSPRVIPRILETRPHVAVIDDPVRSSQMDIDVPVEIRKQDQDLHLVILGDSFTEHTLRHFLELGGASVLLKQNPFQVLVDAILRGYRKESILCDNLRRQVTGDTAAAGSIRPAPPELARLTARQVEVLKLIADGLTVNEVADVLHVSPKAVDSQKYRIMKQLGVHDRVTLTRLAIRAGLIDP